FGGGWVGLAQRWEGGGEVAGGGPHGAAIGGLWLGLAQRWEGGGDVAGAEPHGAAIGGLWLGLAQRGEVGPDRSVICPIGRNHLVSPPLQVEQNCPPLTKVRFSDGARTQREKFPS